MNWHKLVLHDLRDGLMRKRNGFPLVQFTLLCLTYWAAISHHYTDLTCIDYLIYCFKGVKPVDVLHSVQEFSLPILWLQAMGCLLFLCLDYPLNDLTAEGQQWMIRCGSRMGWYLSKCIWNFASSILYFFSAVLVAVLISIISGGALTMQNTPEITRMYVESFEPVTLSRVDILLSVLAAPFASLAALNMLQMVGCFLTKPIYSFLICISILILAIYNPSCLILGNGAMIIRSNLVSADYAGVSTIGTIVVSAAVMVGGMVIGAVRFKRFDILGVDE